MSTQSSTSTTNVFPASTGEGVGTTVQPGPIFSHRRRRVNSNLLMLGIIIVLLVALVVFAAIGLIMHGGFAIVAALISIGALVSIWLILRSWFR